MHEQDSMESITEPDVGFEGRKTAGEYEAHLGLLVAACFAPPTNG
jgi:hypothetical protein